MIIIQNKLVSLDVIEEEFSCNLSACKGMCCVKGDAGAPLAEDELEIMDEILPEVEPYLPEAAKEAIKIQGTSIQERENHYEVPLVDGKECVFVVFKDNVALCGIEMAYRDGKIPFKKPVSCELYPIRVSTIVDMDVLNYDRWDICSPACSLGKELKLPVYKFLKEPLIRRFGEEFYEELDQVAEEYKSKKT